MLTEHLPRTLLAERFGEPQWSPNLRVNHLINLARTLDARVSYDGGFHRRTPFGMRFIVTANCPFVLRRFTQATALARLLKSSPRTILPDSL